MISQQMAGSHRPVDRTADPNVWRRAARAAFATLTASMMIVLTMVGSAGAGTTMTSSCGELSFGFAGTRLIDDGISNSAGPFSISLPAGFYEITMASNDNHPSPDYQPLQTGEQWYFVLDNGFVSPTIDDIPNDQENVVMTFPAQQIGAATAITVHHRGIGDSPNSVNVVCVGFTPVDVSPPPSSSVAPPTSVAAATSVAPPTTVDTEVAGAQEIRPPALATTGSEASVLLVFAAAALIAGGILKRLAGD